MQSTQSSSRVRAEVITTSIEIVPISFSRFDSVRDSESKRFIKEETNLDI